MQSRLIQSLLRLLAPTEPFPPYTDEGAESVNQLIQCRQWLLHAGDRLLDPHQAYDEAWLHLGASANEYGLALDDYRSTPGWDLFYVLRDIAYHHYGQWDSQMPEAFNELNAKEIGAIAGAKGEIFADLESTMTHFRVLFARHQMLGIALLQWDQILQDMEDNL
jgi:hypothetical protein